MMKKSLVLGEHDKSEELVTVHKRISTAHVHLINKINYQKVAHTQLNCSSCVSLLLVLTNAYSNIAVTSGRREDGKPPKLWLNFIFNISQIIVSEFCNLQAGEHKIPQCVFKMMDCLSVLQ